jgi:hypothetical protein
MAGNIFGGGMFGKPIQVKGQQQGAQVPMAGAGQPQAQRPLGVVTPQQQAAPAAQPQVPPGRIPMGKKGDCPICH